MQRRLMAPPGLVVVEGVLGESAHVDHAGQRVDGRPAVRHGFAAIVETGPGKAAGLPVAGGVELPPLFGRLTKTRDVDVVGADGIPQRVGGVFTAGGKWAGSL